MGLKIKNFLQNLVLAITSFEKTVALDFSSLAAKTSALSSCQDQIAIKVDPEDHSELAEKLSAVVNALTQVGSDSPDLFLFMTTLDGASFKSTSLALAKCSLMRSYVKVSIKSFYFGKIESYSVTYFRYLFENLTSHCHLMQSSAI
jgi:hypothetical protein